MRWVTWVFLGFALSSLVGGCGESEKPPQAKNLGGSGTGGRGSAGTGADGGASGTNTPGGSAGSSSRGGAAGRSGNGGTGASEGGAGVGEAGGGAGGGGASGEGGAGMGGGGGDGGETQTFLDRLWGAYCKQIMTCAISNNDVLVQRLYFGTEAACLEALRELLGDEPPTYDLLARIDSGTVRFVPEMADACITEASDCMWEGYFSNGPACRAVFEGTVPVGGDCNRWEECAGAAYCDHTDGCPGRCALLGEPGAPCNSRQQCSPGDGYAVCDWSANDTCRRLSIGPRAGLDEPCTADAVAATEFVLCEDGLFCDAEDVGSTTGICRMPIAVDEACDSSNDVCAGNHACIDETSCEAVVIAHNVGDACDSTTNVYCDIFAGLTCVAGRCEHFGDGTEGSNCRDSDIYQRVTCNHGLYCNRLSDDGSPEGTCQPLLGTSAPCDSNDECANGTCTGTCAASYCDG